MTHLISPRSAWHTGIAKEIAEPRTGKEHSAQARPRRRFGNAENMIICALLLYIMLFDKFKQIS